MEELGIDSESVELKMSGFTVCIHDYQMYRGISKNPMALCKGMGGKPADKDLLNPPIIPEIKGRVIFSLLLRITYEDIAPLKNGDFLGEMENSILRMRFAGGDIFTAEKTYFQDNGRLVEFYNDEKKLFRRMLKLPAGWLIKDRSDLLHGSGDDKLQALLDAVALFPVDDVSKSYRRKYPGWLYATCNGYQLLESPLERPGRRDESLLHAYCEPVHSLAELVHAGKLFRRWSRKDSFSYGLCENRLLWNWQYDESARLLELRAV
jgi:CRISPR-associated protein Csy2